MRKYDVSVIMPVYNKEEYLPRALGSLREQTIGFEKIQLVACDDCSSDRSGELLREFAAQYDNVTALCTKHNSGYAGAPRNLALEQASGEFVMFLDADDFFEPNACETLLFAQSLCGADVVSGYYSETSERGATIRERGEAYTKLRSGEYDLSNGFADFMGASDSLWCKLYKKSVIDQNALRFDEDFPGEDALFLAKYLLCCKNGYYVDKRIVNYRVLSESVSHGVNARFIERTAVFYDRLLAELRERGHEELFKLNLSSFSPVDFFIGRMFEPDEPLCEADANSILGAWKTVFSYALGHGVKIHSPLVRMLAYAAVNGGAADAAALYAQLFRLNSQRRTEKNTILSSNTYQLASRLSGLFGGGRA